MYVATPAGPWGAINISLSGDVHCPCVAVQEHHRIYSCPVFPSSPRPLCMGSLEIPRTGLSWISMASDAPTKSHRPTTIPFAPLVSCSALSATWRRRAHALAVHVARSGYTHPGTTHKLAIAHCQLRLLGLWPRLLDPSTHPLWQCSTRVAPCGSRVQLARHTSDQYDKMCAPHLLLDGIRGVHATSPVRSTRIP
ncbi:hypothetical protein OBBRIDRAFT_791367 [Obba rivulosa]|uniref:Uncharacterized protein n=1 Tax=Obba rivulosa TaxID=1052685 RepID=A0A8E2DN91_9APHY|nr:hypothetical protein OBBRIDRAFT_791367 [Obba rivulosa]